MVYLTASDACLFFGNRDLIFSPSRFILNSLSQKEQWIINEYQCVSLNITSYHLNIINPVYVHLCKCIFKNKLMFLVLAWIFPVESVTYIIAWLAVISLLRSQRHGCCSQRKGLGCKYGSLL